MFINDLPSHVNTQVDIFADDTTLLAPSHVADVEDLVNTLSREVLNVDELATINKLPLNCSKALSILNDGQCLGKCLNNEEHKLEIQFKGCKLGQATSVKLRGLDIDEQLSFDINMAAATGVAAPTALSAKMRIIMLES